MQDKFYTLLSADYTSALILFIMMIIILLLYLTNRYKKLWKKQKLELLEKEEKIKSLRQYAYEFELKKNDKKHEVEKEILNLNHKIIDLEMKLKEGLKSHVAMMIDSHEKKRTQQLEQAGINR